MASTLSFSLITRLSSVYNKWMILMSASPAGCWTSIPQLYYCIPCWDNTPKCWRVVLSHPHCFIRPGRQLPVQNHCSPLSMASKPPAVQNRLKDMTAFAQIKDDMPYKKFDSSWIRYILPSVCTKAVMKRHTQIGHGDMHKTQKWLRSQCYWDGMVDTIKQTL